MTTSISIRDLSRNANVLANYDYVEIEDKKSHELKGLFVSPALADEVKAYLESKAQKAKNDKLTRLKAHAGTGTIDTKYDNLTPKAMRAQIANEKLNG